MPIQTKSLSRLPRNIRRNNLKRAIKSGKAAYDTGLQDGYKRGYDAGHDAALKELAAELQQYRDAPSTPAPVPEA